MEFRQIRALQSHQKPPPRTNKIGILRSSFVKYLHVEVVGGSLYLVPARNTWRTILNNAWRTRMISNDTPPRCHHCFLIRTTTLNNLSHTCSARDNIFKVTKLVFNQNWCLCETKSVSMFHTLGVSAIVVHPSSAHKIFWVSGTQRARSIFGAKKLFRFSQIVFPRQYETHKTMQYYLP